MIFKWVYLALVFMGVLLSGCNKTIDASNEYIGYWQKTSDDKTTLKVERNGESLIIREYEPEYISRKLVQRNIPVLSKNGAFEIATGLGSMTIVIDKSSGNLIALGGEFKRIDQHEAEAIQNQIKTKFQQKPVNPFN